MSHAGCVRCGEGKSSAVLRVCPLVVAIAGALWAMPAAAGGDAEYLAGRLQDKLQIWETVNGRLRVDRAHQYAECTELLKQLAEADPAGTRSITIARDIPELGAGTHPWPAARPACEAIAANIAHQKRVHEFTRWVGGTSEVYQRNCVEGYKAAIQGGVSPTEVVTVEGITATVQEFHEQCAQALAKYKGKQTATEAPYRKVLKGDKLALALDRMGYIFLPRGVEATPATLAAHNVWFLKGESDTGCPGGAKRTTVQRFQFNAQHKRVKTTSREYCGALPASALR